MIYNWKYKTPKEYSNIIMNSDGESLIGLFFEDSKDSSKHEVNCKEEKSPIFEETCKWLDTYFSGKEPDFTPKYKVNYHYLRMKVMILANISYLKCNNKLAIV